jgi:hypothetical protein
LSLCRHGACGGFIANPQGNVPIPSFG